MASPPSRLLLGSRAAATRAPAMTTTITTTTTTITTTTLPPGSVRRIGRHLSVLSAAAAIASAACVRQQQRQRQPRPASSAAIGWGTHHLEQRRVFQSSAPASLKASAARCDSYVLLTAAPTTITTTPTTSSSRHTHSRWPRPRTTSPRTTTAITTATMTAVTVMVHQSRNHGGHHHHHHHDNAYLTSSNKNDAGVRITRLGLYSNLAMAVAKGAGGYAFNSQSMVADAWHSLTDLASDALTLMTVSTSLRPPTAAFPTGFGKIESLGSLGVSGMLLGGGLMMGWGSLDTLYAHFFLDPSVVAEMAAHSHHHHGHLHHHHGMGPDVPNLHAAWLAAGTVAVKEWLYQATMKVARERKSSVLASNAVHHRVDSFTGIVTLLAILGANLLQNAAWLDPVGGLLISLLVIKAGFSNTMSALYELADRSIDDEVKASVRKHATRALVEHDLAAATDGRHHEIEVRDVSGVKSGQNYLVEIEIAVPGTWTVQDARHIETAVRTQVGNKVRGVRKVKVRFVPREGAVAPQFDEFIAGDVSPRLSQEPEEEENNSNNHEHEHEHAHHKHK